jgi:hypothetical protein
VAGERILVVRAEAPDGGLSGPPPVPPPATDSGLPPIVPSDGYNAGVVIDRPLNKTFMDRCHDWFGGPAHSSSAGTHSFHSDTCFAGMISPLSNPFFFEDPRALTEVRPLFFYERFPNRIGTGGGNGEFYGLQGRIAFNQDWSLVINKFGFVSLHPNFPLDGFAQGNGFAEFWLGPKWTFYRCEQSGTVMAAGLTFQLPIGGTKVNQDHGTLGLDPYFTIGQTFGRTSFGAFNFLGELGYNASVDNHRAEFLHGSLHLDYNFLEHFYPLMELNWFYFTQNGKGPLDGFEGTDFVNFGAGGVSGRDLLTLALGMRYKFSENFQTGAYFEVPLTGRNSDLESYRIGLDFIFRY